MLLDAGEIARALAQLRGTEERTLVIARELGRRCELTPAELRILELIASGATHDEIAAEAGIAKKTLHNHLQPIYDKLTSVVGERSLVRIAWWIADHAHYLSEADHERASSVNR